MANFSTVAAQRTEDNASAISLAFSNALQFSPTRVAEFAPSEGDLRRQAEEEAAFGRVIVDANGFTAGMRMILTEPTHQVMATWNALAAAFESALQPFRGNIEAVEQLDTEIEKLRGQRDQLKASQERQASENPDYDRARKRFDVAESKYLKLYNEEGQRLANLAAKSPFYWIGLMCIGIGEWLINYDTFLLFLGIPAIAAGTTVILGILLAFSAHAHGTILRQWSHMFGPHVDRRERFASWRYLGLATFALNLVVGAAGGSRYAAAVHSMASQASPNILGEIITVDPLRDVVLSLLANVAAWAVGVFLAYLTHDKNPEYMDAAYEKHKAEKQFIKLRRRYAAELETIEAKVEKDIKSLENSAKARAQDVSQERDYAMQFDAHRRAVIAAIGASTRRSAEVYRSVIVKSGSGKGPSFLIELEGKQITPFEYQAVRFPADDAIVSAILG